MRAPGHNHPGFSPTRASSVPSLPLGSALVSSSSSSSSSNFSASTSTSTSTSPPASPRGRMCLGLTVDAATLSHSLKYGFLLYDRNKNGRVIFSLKELVPGQVYWTENNNEIKRIDEHQVLLGGTETLPIPEEEDFDPNAGILVFQDEKPLLLADAGKEAVFAEAHIERTIGEKFYCGIPLASGTNGTGMVAFSLHQLPIGCEFAYHATVKGRPPVRIKRLDDKTCQVDGKSYAMAEVKQVLPSDSSILDLAFPSSPPLGRQRRGTICAPVQQPPRSPRDRSYSIAVPSSPRRSAPNCPLEPEVLEMEEIDSIDSETITREKMKEFDERLLDATRRREAEKRAKLTEMMRKYEVPALEDGSAKEADGEADREESDNSDASRDESEDSIESPELSATETPNTSGPVVVVEVLEEIDPPARRIEAERSHEEVVSASEDVRSEEEMERSVVDSEVSGHTASEEGSSEAGERIGFDEEEELEEVALNDSPEAVVKSKNVTDRGGEATGKEEAVIPDTRGTEKVEELDQEQEPQEIPAKANDSLQLPHGISDLKVQSASKPGNAKSRAGGGPGRGRGRGQPRANTGRGRKGQRKGGNGK